MNIKKMRSTLPLAALVVGGAFLATVPTRNSSGSNVQSIDTIINSRPYSISSANPNNAPFISYMSSTLIALDPGHDDTNIGTNVKGPLEAKLNLIDAEILNDSLQSKGYDVISTRYDGSRMNIRNIDMNKDHKVDEDDEVQVRSDYIKSNHARLALMLHHNSTRRSRAIDGVEVYYLGETSLKRLIDQKKNYARNHRIHYSPPELCTAYSDSSKYIAEKLVQGFLDKGIKAKAACADMPLLLNNPARITILIEFGYLSNKSDLKRAMSKEGQEQYAGIVAEVINSNRDYIFGNGFYAPLLDTRSMTAESSQDLYDRLLFNHIKKGDGKWFDINSGRQDYLAGFRTEVVQKEKERRSRIFANFLREKDYRARTHSAD